MVKHLVILLSFYLISTQLLLAQQNKAWQFYPSFSTVNSLSSIENQTVATTDGGIITIINDEIKTLGVLEGLYGSDAESVLIDDITGLVYLGYSDGSIDIINIQEDSNNTLDDIRRVERFDSKSINSFSISDESLLVATDFGVVEYDLESLLVRNSYFKFGDFNYGIRVTDLLVHNDSLFVTTTEGVAAASIQEELNNNSVWTTYNENEGLNSFIVDKIVSFTDSIYVLNDREIKILRNGNWEEGFPEINDEIIDISVSIDHKNIAILTDNRVYVYDQNYSTEVLNVDDLNGKNSIGITNQKVLIGTDYTGIYSLNIQNSDVEQILPEGPQFNFLNKLLIDNEVLLGTSTSEFPGFDPLNPFRGYSLYNGNNWENYSRLYNTELSNVETVYSVGQTSEAYYFGSWGDGVIKHNKTDNQIDVFNSSNSILTGINSDEDFIVISGLENDSNENIWAISFLSQYPLNVLKNGSNVWETFENVTISDNYYNLFIDSNDQKWISLITNTNTGLGLLILNTNDPDTQNDDEYVKITENPERGNLPHPKVNAIVEDRDGEIWIGTDRGLARFIFPEFIINGSANDRQAQWLINEDTTAASRFLLRDLNVSALAVNSANQKWIGSRNQGVWLLNSEGSRILKRFTVENSNLISNNINDIKINEQTGEVFISTDLGLVSIQDVPKVAEDKMNSLKVYPNPFKYSDHDQILIEGLTEETTIKILGIDGFVVNALKTRGGRVSWNGRDFNGNKLGTGVYYVVANSADGNEKGIGKVVIVN